MGTYYVLGLSGCMALIRGWALINFLGFQGGHLFEVGACAKGTKMVHIQPEHLKKKPQSFPLSYTVYPQHYKAHVHVS